jgi:hypothetical protein
MSFRIVKAFQTSTSCPSQWDARTDTGEYLYLWFCSGRGTASRTEGGTQHALVSEFFDVDPYAGSIGLQEFCDRAGFELALDGAV